MVEELEDVEDEEDVKGVEEDVEDMEDMEDVEDMDDVEPVVVVGPKGIREASYIIPPSAHVSSMSPIMLCAMTFVVAGRKPYPLVNRSWKYEPVKQ